jgi:glycosyltransferase involved in cell wall biosynthesis
MVYFCSDFGVTEKFDPGFGVKFKWDIPLLEGYQYKFLKNHSPRPELNGFWGLLNLGIVKELLMQRYDAIYVHGYNFLTNWLAFIAARLTGTPILLRTISHILDKRPLYIRIAKEVVLRFLFNLVQACLYIGEHNLNYYKRFGVAMNRVFFVPHVVDNDFFAREYNRLKSKVRDIRFKWGIYDNRPVILFAGKLIPKKQPLLLLEAYRQVRQRCSCALLYAGDGPLRIDIESRVYKENIPDVIITGFLNQTEISEAYTAGDILVLPSFSETWGLVVNEGMNFGLPIIISDKVGCGSNCVRDGENGYIVPYTSFSALVEAITELVVNPQKRYIFGKRSLEIIKSSGLEQFVNGVVEALRVVSRK